MSDRILYSTLVFAGVFPFLACALLPLAGISVLPRFGSVDQLANSYGLAIICFLAGIHWATYLLRQDEHSLNLIVSSNIVFLLVWIAFVLTELDVSLFIQIVSLSVLLYIDWRLKNSAVISSHYFQIRLIATALAVVALASIILA